MKLSAKHLEYARNLFACLSVLALPWQTRWIAQDIWLNGYPWEQGRWALYATWVPMIAVIGVAFFAIPMKGEIHKLQPRWIPALVGMIVILFHSSFFSATAQWLLQITLLVVWMYALRSLNISRETLFLWFAWSLVPVGVLACIQWFSQTIIASSWLGIASHVPSDRGAFIVETAHGRWLRAYGTFPHPNILGAWFAVLALGALLFYRRTQSRVYAFIAPLACLPLFFSQSRSALLALGVACLLVGVGSVKKILWFMVGVLLVLITTFSWVVIPRVTGTAPAESRSLQERVGALSQGWELFRQHPWLGSGPNASGALWHELHPWRDTQADGVPYVPIHNVFILAVVELGILGTLLVLVALYRVRSSWTMPFAICLFFLLFSLFDHALWSWWSGQALLALTLIFSRDSTS